MNKKLIALVLIAALIVVLAPPKALSSNDILARTEQLEQVKFFKSLYPDAKFQIEKRACVKKLFSDYIKRIDVPLVNRERDIICFDKKQDWLVTYSATGIVDTTALWVGFTDQGELIDVAFTSPYDDVYVTNYTIKTTSSALKIAFSNNGIKMHGGWGFFKLNDTRYTFYTIPSNKLIVLLYIESVPGYGLPTTESLTSDILRAHQKFEEGKRRIDEVLSKSFGNFNSSSYYLYFPELS